MRWPLPSALPICANASCSSFFAARLPTVVCEAMNCGLPVVATAVDGTPEAVRDGETGLLVPPRDPEALADALGRLLDDAGLRGRMGEAALRIGREEYTWDANARRMSAIYEGLR